MYRKISTLLIGLAALAAPLALTAPASADSGPTLYCQVITNNTFLTGGVGAGSCSTPYADSSYVIDLGVGNGHDSYTWFPPGGLTVVAGCNSSTAFCDLLVHATKSDQNFTTWVVTDDSSGTPVSISATATIPAVCGTELC